MLQLNSFRKETAMYNSSTSIPQIQQSVKAALEAVMGDASPEVLEEMSSIFLEDAVPLIAQVKSGLATHDFNAISIAAHTLKGSSATLGLEKFAEICLALEIGSKAEEASEIGGLLPSLEAEYQHIEQALRHFLP